MASIAARASGEVGEGAVTARCLREKRARKRTGRGVLSAVREDLKEAIDESVSDILRDW